METGRYVTDESEEQNLHQRQTDRQTDKTMTPTLREHPFPSSPSLHRRMTTLEIDSRSKLMDHHATRSFPLFIMY